MHRIKNIEFFRFLFAIMIVYAHIMWFCCSVFNIYIDFPLYMKLWSHCSDSFLCVEYFFIIAGFFLFFHIKNKKDETLSFAVNKIVRLWPLLALSIFCIGIISSLFKFVDFYSYSNVLNLLFLLMTCIGKTLTNNMHSWFVCVLFWCSIFYHYIGRNFNVKITNFIIGILIFYSYTQILNWNNGSIPGVHSQILNGISGGMLRGFASIGLGYFVGMFWTTIAPYVENYKIKNKLKSSILFVALSIIEIYLFVFLINNSLFHRISFNNDFIFIVVFTVLFILFLAKKGLLSKLLENNLSVFLGKFSYSIYIMQAVGFVIAKHFFWEDKIFVHSHPYLNIVYTIIVCLFIGIISHYLIEKPCIDYFKRKSLVTQTINIK